MTKSHISIPPGFIDKFLWPPFKDIAADGTAEPINDQSSDHPALPQSYAFSDSVLCEVLAAASYAFSPALQLGGMELSEFRSLNNDEDLPEEPSICLFTPYEGCHEIIDSMIQSVANRLDADVIVLDALELALGEFGALGKDIGRAIGAVYEPKPKLYPSRIQGAFDAIVTVSNQVQPSTGVDLTEPSKCRFIYLRDFGSIAPSAKPFITHLLRAIRVRRSAAYEKQNALNSSGILHPTVLVMGFDKAWTIDSKDDSFNDYLPLGLPNPKSSARSRGSIFSEGGDALRKTLPALDNQLFRLKAQFSKISLKPLSAAFFLPLVSKSSQVETAALSLTENTVLPGLAGMRQQTGRVPMGHTPATLPALGEECICLIPRNFQESFVCDLTRRAAIKRKTDVQKALFLLFLRQKGALVADDFLSLILNSAVSADSSSGANINDVVLSDVLGDHPEIPFPVAVSRIAIQAIGLAHTRPYTQVPIRIDAEDVWKAHALFFENSQMRSNWVNETSAGAGVKEKKDPIVESVKNCKDLNEHEQNLLQCIVDLSLPTTFDNVCIDPDIIQSLNDVVSLPLRHPTIFKKGILARESIGGVLLYGPPGTGKTMVCRAIARECGARMLQVRPSDVINKWLGNSENLARNVFNLAYRLAPCVIFFDEIDSLFRSRTSEDSGRHTGNIAMDGLQSAQKNRDAGVVVVGATNRPFDLDEAVLRRLPTRLLVKLPDEIRRKEILQVHLQGEDFPEVQLDELSRKTDGYSGSDLKNLCVSAATEAAKESVTNATTNGIAVHAGGPDLPSRVLAPKHFEHALTRVSPSTRDNSELDRWQRSFTRQTGADRNSELDGWYKSLVGRTSGDRVGSIHCT
ncbi:putative AAA domain-containing protein C16E9.10c [Mycena venus]|uniref:Putative AAA domain-containing protein C16E9.10c n=1 Tax=Mycena venus TaxID=2733690 RepID=A0A8H7D4C9_9AGAR|nr:putative AAA domain-containing protein C16E9.10c [Mycena venus]